MHSFIVTRSTTRCCRCRAGKTALFFLCLCLTTLAGCAGRNMPEDSGLRPQFRLAHMRDVEDLRRLPQDLTVYARRGGWDKTLMSPEEQARQTARFERIFFSPWLQTAPSVPAAELTARFGEEPRRARSRAPRKAPGVPKAFDERGLPWSREDWAALQTNANLAAYPSLSRPGIIVRETSLREAPTARARMAQARALGADNPFDLFQYSALPLGTPVYLTHSSADGLWRFAQSPVAAGWVLAADTATTDAEFMKQYRIGRYATVIRDNLPVRTKDSSSGMTHVGAIYPLIGRHADGLKAGIPLRREDGSAELAETLFDLKQARPWPLPASPAWMAAVGNQMMGQQYGLYEGRDCSATVRDLFAPFGIHLPRNSAAQARAGLQIPLEGPATEKERRIAEEAVPFMSLLRVKGHIMLYLGRYQGENIEFHNVWGVRITEDGTDARHIIGRAVVTSLRMGTELPSAKKNSLLVDRLLSITMLPDAGRP